MPSESRIPDELAAAQPSEADEDLDTAVRELEESLRKLLCEQGLPEIQPEPRHLAAPRIGKYEVQKVLGRHGQAAVVVAFDPDLQRQVVLKLYHADLSSREQERLFREGQALARISSPFVVRCFGIEHIQGSPCLILEYVQGQTLDQWCEVKSIDVPQSLELFTHLAQGLCAVHDEGLVHGDIKPRNIIVAPDGRPKLIDFGLVRQQGNRESLAAAGTAGFMAPEQADPSSPSGPPQDIYSYGVVGQSWLKSREGRPVEAKHETVVETLEQVFARCVMPDPSDRFPSMHDLVQQLEQRRVELNRNTTGLSTRARVVLIVAAFSCLAVLIALIAAQLKPATNNVRFPTLSNGQLRNDFNVGVRINGESIEQQSPSTLEFANGERIEIEVRPESDAFVAIFSLEQRTAGGAVDYLDLLYPGQTDDSPTGRVRSGDSIRLELQAKHSTKTEYLLVFACNEAWDMQHFVSTYNASEKNSYVIDRGLEPVWRSLTRLPSSATSELCIPYIVTP